MSTSKTLPMKFKAMHYALLAYITQSDEFTPDVKIGLIAKLPVHDSVENQVIFYEKMVDFKTVEKDIVKPMMKKKKQDETAAAKPVKEKKPRATKTTATTPVAPTPTPVAPTPTPAVPAPVAEEKPKKKRVVKKKAEQPNPTTPEQMEEKAQEEMMSLTDEMKEEPYQPVTLTPAAPPPPPPPPPPSLAKATKKKETTSVKKAVVKKAVKAAVAVAEVEEKSDVEEPELEKYLIIRDGVRYWTSDEFEKNGEVYEYCIDSEGDGCAGNVAIGCLKDGKLILN